MYVGDGAQSEPDDSDLRRAVRDSVLARVPVDEREQRSLAVFIEQFDALAEPFSETAGPVHVTGSVIIVGDRGVIMLKHRTLGIWVQPGGHVDPGETPWDAALREAHEETGLVVEHADGTPHLVHVDVHSGGKGHTHLDLRYLCRAGNDDPAPPPEESQDVHWFTWDEAIELADDGVAGALRELRPVLEGDRFP